MNDNTKAGIMIAAIVIIVLLAMFCSFSCCTTPPVIIREMPQIDLTDDMTISDYMRESESFKVQITAYTLELIAQIKIKTNYIDMRKKEK